jgi:UDP-galactose transporter B1
MVMMYFFFFDCVLVFVTETKKGAQENIKDSTRAMSSSSVHASNGTDDDGHSSEVNLISTLRAAKSVTSKQIYHFIQCTVGIYICFIILSLYQERIMKKIYPRVSDIAALHDSDHEHVIHDASTEDVFRYTIFIVFLTCLVNTVFSYFRIRIYHPKVIERGVPAISFGEIVKFMVASLFFVCGTLFSHSALSYVAYPTQVLTKSCKLIPVMLSTIVLARKTYRTSRYLVVLFISIGISIFMLNRMKNNEIHKMSHRHIFLTQQEDRAYDHSQFRVGVVLLLLSLIMDGLTNGVQTLIYNEMAKRNRDPNSDSDVFMLHINFYAMVFSCITCIVYESELLLSIEFILTHKEIIWDLSVLCLCMAFGQMFIFRTITTYGPLVCSMITTTRKFFTIIFSVVLFRHKLTGVQWAGVFIVFSALLFDVYTTLQVSKEQDRIRTEKGDDIEVVVHSGHRQH